VDGELLGPTSSRCFWNGDNIHFSRSSCNLLPARCVLRKY